MSTPATILVSGTFTLAVTPTPLPSGNAPQQGVTLVVTDSAGTTYPSVSLTGAESPLPWSFSATYASGAATAIATAVDTSGNPIGAPATLGFTVTAVVPQTFSAPTGLTFTAATASAAAAAVHKANSVKT